MAEMAPYLPYVVIFLTVAFVIFCEMFSRGSLALGWAAAAACAYAGVAIIEVAEGRTGQILVWVCVGLAPRAVLRFSVGVGLSYSTVDTAISGPARLAAALGQRERGMPSTDWAHAVLLNFLSVGMMWAAALSKQSTLGAIFLIGSALVWATFPSIVELMPAIRSNEFTQGSKKQATRTNKQ